MLGEQGAETDACPLDLANLEFVAFGDRHGVSVELSVPDAALVPELQRRVDRHLTGTGRTARAKTVAP